MVHYQGKKVHYQGKKGCRIKGKRGAGSREKNRVENPYKPLKNNVKITTTTKLILTSYTTSLTNVGT